MKNKKGFTLVELLAVIVILGVLLMIAVPAVQNVIKKTKNNATQKQAELFIDAAKKMAIIDEATSDMVIYKLSDLDSDVDKNRFTGMVVALKENGSYKYYIYLNDSVNKKTIGNNNNNNDIFEFASEDNINENVTDGVKKFKEGSTQIIKVNNNTYSYSNNSNTLNTYYSVKENVTVTVGDNTYTGIVIKSRGTIRVLLTQQKTIMSYTSIKKNLITGTTIPTLEDIKILSGNNTISNNFCDGKYTAQADCSSGFKSGYNAGVAIWLSCGNSDSCPCKENGDITSGATYCPRLAVNGSIHTRGLASSGIYFMPVIEVKPSQVKSSS